MNAHPSNPMALGNAPAPARSTAHLALRFDRLHWIEQIDRQPWTVLAAYPWDPR